MLLRLLPVAGLLFCSGTCALIYQVAWLREFRLIFGASTAASAAVLAIFMGGLGVGSVFLGRLADRSRRPLFMYAHLELMIAVSAALTPLAIKLVRAIYLSLGGSLVMGPGLATISRLVLSALVLLIPTILMGGTLPAAARAVETSDDLGRRRLAVLYGANTLGAVTGVFLSTFFMIEIFGVHLTLWLACLINLGIGISARALARRLTADEPPETTKTSVDALEPSSGPSAESAPYTPAAPKIYVLIAAGLVGFVFLLMELVWYRLLGPILGGSTYTFGLILAVALLGIGLGGWIYSAHGQKKPATITAFSMTLAAEAFFIALPYLLGDRLAVLALLLRDFRVWGFSGQVLGWATVALIVVFPASVIAGIQFPVLIGLLGRGRQEVGRQTGLAYAWNTGGAILGSLAGGFGLLPLLTAPGVWRIVVVLLSLLGIAAVLLALRLERKSYRLVISIFLVLCSGAMIIAQGPTSVWRHSGIGAGRAILPSFSDVNAVQEWANHQHWALFWEAEGVESSVGVLRTNNTGLAFAINGKIDGSAIGDAGTQVMLGVLGAILHPNPKKAMVIGLGTGSSAGWLAKVESINRVDAVELEPAILHVARDCAPVNQRVMDNPKVKVIIGDGREVLQTTRERYDLIASEPSNPYRAGIASLFTREFYQAVAARLEKGGLFLQWVQAYEVNAATIRTIYATLSDVFPVVETWQTNGNDLLLVCSAGPLKHQADFLDKQVKREPFRSALLKVWRANDLSGLLARFVAGPELAKSVAIEEKDNLCTDDWTIIEYEFARTMGRSHLFSIEDLRSAARRKGLHRPIVTGSVDWDQVEDRRADIHTMLRQSAPQGNWLNSDQSQRVKAQWAFISGDLAAVLTNWRAQPQGPAAINEIVMLAEALAEAGDRTAEPLIEKLRTIDEIEAEVVAARLALRLGQPAQALERLQRAFSAYRQDPWPLVTVMERAMSLAREIYDRENPKTTAVFESLSQPFSVLMLEPQRLSTLLDVSPGPAQTVKALAWFEPNIPWNMKVLTKRRSAYAATSHPLAAPAEADVIKYLTTAPISFSQTLGLVSGERP